jgi:hypothetical protein
LGELKKKTFEKPVNPGENTAYASPHAKKRSFRALFAARHGSQDFWTAQIWQITEK